ncbi:hypothetical protein IIC65_09260, partial [Candidatus Sumerlaeota bacterium]|nr:hypothetical protein [Candidatus Sumerlaeota bacterium]
MNLNFGKREQIVVILVSGIVLIAALHLFSFSRRATEFARVYEELDGYWGEVERLRVLNNSLLLDDYESDTELVEVAYNDALTSLGLTLEEVWKVPSFNSFVLDPPTP